MNTEQAAGILVENLSLNTLRKMVEHLEKTGEQNPDITRAEKVLKNHFAVTIDRHFDNAVSPGEILFYKYVQVFFPEPIEEMTREQEEQINKLHGLYGEGYLQGYLAGAADLERFFQTLNSKEEQDTIVF